MWRSALKVTLALQVDAKSATSLVLSVQEVLATSAPSAKLVTFTFQDSVLKSVLKLTETKTESVYSTANKALA